ncbi:MAG: FAD binding domain-containing protein [Syntrophales bacterium]|nr:FAD binding domain-containing protein [Syntrophales bacterium]MDP3097701.1 FAD binding domain-containing protein [Syntrophales bacterium]
MKLPPFQYLEPSTVLEALSMLDTYRDTVQIIAGGTEVVNRLKLRLISPDYLMDIKKLPDLGGIAEHEQSIVIGANVSLNEIRDSSLLQDKYKAIAEAAFQVAAPPLANMGTIGGNILQNTRCLFYNQSEIVLKGLGVCHKRGGASCLAVKGGKRCFSVYLGDIAPALIAFDAKCVLEKSGSRRTIPIIDLFTGMGTQPLSIENNELLTGIIIPKQNGAYGSAYRKLRIRGSIDYPLASAAAFLALSADGKLAASRLVIGAAGCAPKVVARASAALSGKLPEDADFAAAADMAYELSEGVDNLALPGDYRRKMVRVLAQRALQGARADIKRGM